MNRRVILGAPRLNVCALDDVILHAHDYAPASRIHRALKRHDNQIAIARNRQFFIQGWNEQSRVKGFLRRQDQFFDVHIRKVYILQYSPSRFGYAESLYHAANKLPKPLRTETKSY